MKHLLLAPLAAALMTSWAAADTLQLPPRQHWLALASSQDKDTAIGIARVISNLPGARVVSSKSGFYAVIAGPYRQNSIKDIKKADKNNDLDDLPPDALLSQGANYLETIWTPLAPDRVFDQKPYDLKKPAELSDGSVKIKVQGRKLSEDLSYTIIDGSDGPASFHFDIGKDASGDDAGATFEQSDFNKAGFVRLLPGDAPPALVVTNFTGGAHCCTLTSIVSKPSATGNWQLTKGEGLDGEGYMFEDPDGDGALELLSYDNAFYYAFDSYAGSVAPLVISKLKDGKLEDVTAEPDMRPRLRQQLAGLEFETKANPDLWKANGFLAGWVALKIRLGEGDAAWATFMQNYQKDSDFGPQICTTGGSVDNCPQDKLQQVPIPKALAQFLKDNNYLPLPAGAEAELK